MEWNRNMAIIQFISLLLTARQANAGSAGYENQRCLNPPGSLLPWIRGAGLQSDLHILLCFKTQCKGNLHQQT